MTIENAVQNGSAADAALTITVIEAVYGALQGSTDVTQQVQALVNKNQNFVANDQTFGDPAPGYGKHFGMTYTDGINDYSFACNEGQTVKFPTRPATSIKVIGAAYGAVQGSMDVTAAVQQLVEQGNSSIDVSTTTFGDPAPGFGKHFAMIYDDGTSQFTVACNDGQTVPLK